MLARLMEASPVRMTDYDVDIGVLMEIDVYFAYEGHIQPIGYPSTACPWENVFTAWAMLKPSYDDDGLWDWLKSKKQIISYLWWKTKGSIAEWFAHSQVSLWYDKVLNELVTKGPPIYDVPNLPEIALSALAETGQAEFAIPVLKQRTYTGNKPVIASALANTPCAVLGIDGVFEKLNTTLGTSYSLGSKVLHPVRETTLHSILEPYVARNDDFGTVYAHLRHVWYSDAVEIEHALRIGEEEDREMRGEVLIDDRITRWDVPPRRVWDLYANRVVPYWVADKDPSRPDLWGISHAWVDEKDRIDVMTPINGDEWPVPMPKDTNLDLIRIEMLNLGAEYAWLDVLCLRQKGGKKEHLRAEEWKLDVPTIGYVYRGDWRVICYFNGLGRPLHLTLRYFKSDRCWFRRAWTLKEMTEHAVIGGETGHDIMENDVRKVFDEQLAHLREMRKRSMAPELVLEMQNRTSSKPLDKVAGLAYLLQSGCIPIYDAEMSDTDAWEMLMDIMPSRYRAQLFFYFPEPGKGRRFWRPSWQQIMTIKHLVPCTFWWLAYVYQMGDTWCEGYCIHSAHVQGLDKGQEEENPRRGKMVFKNHTFKIFADHMFPIPDGSYTLIGVNDCSSSFPLNLWVVGRLKEDRKFEKLSVFRLADDEQENLRKLGLKIVKNFLS
ncbi:hypothetical protein EDD18DRAFT_1377286 [Armillaria luteobubalina]|uniref:Heterokaryon incompatibility domain-containing protein n=1 Tax=Armillaria luteobubalina TaxID=153913 RepID=A0AA39UR52_9AGAR|nr:hypothetical protein EDD18DRAFT_1377286 [Armillaria luteobubalina]